MITQDLLEKIITPCFVLDEELLKKNLKILDSVQKNTGCRILLALKAFAMFKTFPIIKLYLQGVCASGLNEAKLGYEELGREVHVFSPAYTNREIEELSEYADYIIFNSFFQWRKFKPMLEKSRKPIEFGIRVNPEKSPRGVKFNLYNPCAENSRLGVRLADFKDENLEGITGLHFHVLCEQGVDALEEVLAAFEQKFSSFLKNMKWVNFGGGHHITKKGYNLDKLCRLIKDFQKRHPNIKIIYLEPGEAVVLNAGFLVSTVLDIIHAKKNIAILDASAENHLVDLLLTKNEPEPYQPKIIGAGKSGEFNHNYILGGITCAAGDVIGEYSFPHSLKIGDKLVFTDAAHYSMVKTSHFNGINPPSIAIYKSETGVVEIIRQFGYQDYKKRLS